MRHKALLYFIFVLSIFSTSCDDRKYTIKERAVGYRGEAKRNPYLASMRLLQQQGIEVTESSRMVYNFEEYGTIITPVSAITAKSDIIKIRRFIQEGGHFICTFEYGSKDYRDFSDTIWFYDELDSEVIDTFASDYGIEVKWGNMLSSGKLSNDTSYSDDKEAVKERTYEVPQANDLEIPLPSGVFTARLGGDNTFRDKDSTSVKHSTENASDKLNFKGTTYKNAGSEDFKFLSKPYGSGRVTFISDARFMRNPHIATQNHASVLLDMVALSDYGSGKILFSSGKTPTFLELMWKHYKYFSISLVGLLLVWTVAKIRRFGPMIEVAYEQPLNYLKNIEAGGFFLWKNKKADYLIQSIRQQAELLTKLDRATEEHKGQLYNKIAFDIEESEELVRELFENPKLSDTMQFMVAVQKFQKIIKHYE